MVTGGGHGRGVGGGWPMCKRLSVNLQHLQPLLICYVIELKQTSPSRQTIQRKAETKI